MTEMNCKDCQTELCDLLLEDSRSSKGQEGLCPACRHELAELQATLALLDDWKAPEPSAYFDTRLYARLREEQAAPTSLRQRLAHMLQSHAGWAFRPALAGLLGLGVVVGGSTAAVSLLSHRSSAPAVSSPTVNDLKIYDNNAQALQQMDMLDDIASTTEPQS